MRAGLPDFGMSEEFLVVDGDVGVGHYRCGGTPDGEFMGMPATDRAVDTTGATPMRMDGDRTVEMWVYGHDGEVMEQLGVERSRCPRPTIFAVCVRYSDGVRPRSTMSPSR